MFKGLIKEYKVIGICCSKINTEYVRNTVTSINRCAEKRGFKILLFNTFQDLYNKTPYTAGEKSIFSLVNHSVLDALVILSESLRDEVTVDEIVSKAKEANIPVFSVDMKLDGCCSILFDYVDTFEEIVRHVIEHHGCRRVNFIGGLKGNDFSESRVDCYKKVLAENGIEFEEERLGYGDFWEEPTKQVMGRFFLSDLPFPEAIICSNDTMAITACQMLRAFGYRIPEDVIVTGFDGIELEKYCIPRLTTASSDVNKLGETITDMVATAVGGGEIPDEVRIPYAMRVSQSCGCTQIAPESAGTKVLDLYKKISDSSGHEDFMYQYLTSSIECDTLKKLGKVICTYSDVNSWCCLNSDFLEETRDKNRYHGYFTRSMVAMVRRAECHITTNVGFYAENLLPNLEEAFEHQSCIMFMPIHFQDEIIGYEAVGVDNENFNFQNTNRILNYTTQILENFKYRKSLERVNAKLADMHMRDPMTGIFNRRGFYKNAVKLINKCRRNGRQAVIFSVDMDGLKHINDTYGHSEGDKAIKAVSNALMKSTEGDDICSRFGGDEFVVLASPENKDEYMDLFVERVKRCLQDYNKKSKSPYEVVISCGTASMKITSVESLDDFIKIADEKMYEQKRKHKQCTMQS